MVMLKSPHPSTQISSSGKEWGTRISLRDPRGKQGGAGCSGQAQPPFCGKRPRDLVVVGKGLQRVLTPLHKVPTPGGFPTSSRAPVQPGDPAPGRGLCLALPCKMESKGKPPRWGTPCPILPSPGSVGGGVPFPCTQTSRPADATFTLLTHPTTTQAPPSLDLSASCCKVSSAAAWPRPPASPPGTCGLPFVC